MNNLKVSVFHICEHTSILWELCGIKQQVESRILVDYQYYRVLRWGQAWEHRLSSVPRTEALALPIKVEQTTPEPTPI